MHSGPIMIKSTSLSSQEHHEQVYSRHEDLSDSLVFFSLNYHFARIPEASLVVRFQKKVGENAPLSVYYKPILTDSKWQVELGGPTLASNPTHHLVQLVSCR